MPHVCWARSLCVYHQCISKYFTSPFTGKFDELNKLLGEGMMDQERLQQLLGDSKEDAERRLQERLALRKKRLAEGVWHYYNNFLVEIMSLLVSH